MMENSEIKQPFLTDIKTLRERARQNIGEEGGVTFTYEGDVEEGDRHSSGLYWQPSSSASCGDYTMHAVAASWHFQ